MSKGFILFIGVSSCQYEQNISISIDTFNFDVICNSGQKPRSDMRPHWMIMLHTRIFKANYSPLLKFLLRAFFENESTQQTLVALRRGGGRSDKAWVLLHRLAG